MNVDKNYIKLAQLVNYLNLEEYDRFKGILESDDYDVNYAVPIDSQYFKPERWGFTALHFVVISGLDYRYLDCVLRKNADFTSKNHKNFTPLRLAYEVYTYNYYDSTISVSKSLINHLLSAHIKFNNPINPCCNNGLSHLHIACLLNNLEVVKYFLDSGVSINEAINAESSIFPGYTCLHLAIKNNQKSMVKLLLKYNADFGCLNTEGLTPFHLINDKQLNYPSIKKWILYSISKYSKSTFSLLNKMGFSRFHLLCLRSVSIIDSKNGVKFLNNGIDVNAAVSFDSQILAGFTPLHFAVYGNLQTVMVLLEAGANLMVKDVNGITPFDLCLKSYSPIEISGIMKFENTYKSIRLPNDTLLVDLLCILGSACKLKKYVTTKNINNRISFDSPLWPGFTLLHLAVLFSHKEDVSTVRLCLKLGANTAIQAAKGTTALHLAFRMNKDACVNEILKFIDTSVNPTDQDNLAHFHIACTVKNIAAVKLFLNTAGVDLNMVINTDICKKIRFQSPHGSGNFYHQDVVLKDRFSPLHIAAITECEELAVLLIKHDANPHLLDADGLTWVHREFLIYNFLKFKKSLWLHPEALNSNPIARGTGLSHLHIACFTGSSSAVEALLQLSVSRINESVNENLKYLEPTPYKLNLSLQSTPLHFAVIGGSEKIVTLLLKNGASIAAKDAQGRTPLHLAMLEHYYKANIMKSLARRFEQDNLPDDTGLSRLHVAIFMKDTSKIKRYLKSKKDMYTKMKADSWKWPGETPLHTLLKSDVPEKDDLVNLFLNQILENDPDSRPFHGSTKRRKVDSKSHKYFTNLEGLSAFHISCMGSDADIVKKFLKLGADINAPTDYLASTDGGFTPLHFAAKYGGENVIQLLLKSEAMIDLEDANGVTPLYYYAASKYHNKFKKFIRQPDGKIDVRVVNFLLDNNKAEISNSMQISQQSLFAKKDLSNTMYIVSEIARIIPPRDLESMLKENVPNLTEVDAKGRNFIHHLVLSHKHARTYINIDKFVEKIEIFIKGGCELDHQDNEGKTPLHYSVLSKNYFISKALLNVGADINVTDNDNKTPYSLSITSNLYQLFKSHVSKLCVAGSYLNTLNKQHLVGNNHREYTASFDKQKDYKVTASHTLKDILAEKMLTEFPFLPLSQRQEILEYLHIPQACDDWGAVFQWQRRNFLRAQKALKPAMIALYELVDPRLPEHCIELILMNLSYEDWLNLIREFSVEK